DGDGFTVGTDDTVNTNGNHYEYIAFGNANSPHRAGGAADFSIGFYMGNGISGRAIDHLGFDPDMVAVKRVSGNSTLANWVSSSMAANTGAYFSATADVTNGTIFQSLDTNGFTIGNGATVNAANGPYVWFGFAEGDYFAVGS